MHVLPTGSVFPRPHLKGLRPRLPSSRKAAAADNGFSMVPTCFPRNVYRGYAFPPPKVPGSDRWGHQVCCPTPEPQKVLQPVPQGPQMSLGGKACLTWSWLCIFRLDPCGIPCPHTDDRGWGPALRLLQPAGAGIRAVLTSFLHSVSRTCALGPAFPSPISHFP